MKLASLLIIACILSSSGRLSAQNGETKPYARRGSVFKLADIRSYWDKLDWNMPMAVDITARFIGGEKKNAELIWSFEKYSGDFYDGFGR